MDFSDDYRDGFIDSLRVDTENDTRMAATRSDRSAGNYTVFENGVYTACAPCKDDPKKPPLWQVKGARIIHNQEEKMLYFENAQLEFFGVPMAYLPFLSTPDPTVKRKTGFLMPAYSTTTGYGFGVETPFYWAIAPDYDLTLSPRITTRQGPLLQAEFRQRLLDGSYSIKGYGIYQLDPGAYAGQPGDRNWRGGVDTHGQFALNDKWVWGWDGVFLSDYMFMQDYRLAQYRDPLASFLTLPTEAISQLYLTGVGNRSFFDARTIYYLSFSGQQDAGAGDPPGRRLQQRRQQQHLRRRVQLQDELHEPDAQYCGVRPDHDGCQHKRPLRALRNAFRRSARADCPRSACCAACPAPIRGRQ